MYHIAGIEAGIEGLEAGLENLAEQKAELQKLNAEERVMKIEDLEEIRAEISREKASLLNTLAEQKSILAEKRALGIYPPEPPEGLSGIAAIEAEMSEQSAKDWAAAERARIEAMTEEMLLQQEDLSALQAHRQAVVIQRQEALIQAAQAQRQNIKTDRIEAELKKDGFYNGGKYKVKFNAKHLKINGKKQSKTMYEKYSRIMEEMNVADVKDFEIHIIKDENSRSSSYNFKEEKTQ